MQFTKLRLSGFKSFAQPTELLIEPGLTGVVGPNGCGKSNLVEALRWIMGETSARGLRGGEMDDVIFAGTVSRSVFDLAEVSLWLNGAPVSLPGLGEVEEIELCRRIGRGAGSAFRINGKDVRARDVQLLFADAASGARSAAIISQGQVGALVEAKPAERRRLLEDAAGIGGLQARRHEAELKLQAAEANLVRLDDLLTNLGEQRERLHKQARQAKRYRDIGAAWREAEAALLVGRWQAARAALVAAEEELERARARIRAETDALEEARAERDQAAAVLPRLGEAEAEAGAELARLTERLNTTASEARELESCKAALYERRDQVAKDRAHAEAALADARGQLERLQAEHAALLDADPGVEADLRARDREVQEASRAAEDEDARLRQAMTAVAALEARERHLLERRDELVRQADEAAVAEQAARTRQAELAEAEEAAPAAVGDDAERELSAALGAVKEAEAELAEADERRSASWTALKEAEQRLEQLEGERRALADAAHQRESRRAQLLERQHELGERRARLAERRAQLADRRKEHEARREGLTLDALVDAVANASAAADAARAELDRRRATQAALVKACEDARSAAQAVRTTRERVRAEAEALAEIADPASDFPGIEAAIAVHDGLADALAAGLGDDLLASLDPQAPAHWRNGADGGDVEEATPLPEGCEPLLAFVSGPPVLAPRLAQIGVVEPDRAASLQPRLAQGQRLVSRDGGLWRWDGLVRTAAASRAAAGRLRQQARRRELMGELEDLEARLDQREAAVADAENAVHAAAVEVENAEAAHLDALASLEAARQALADARATDAGIAAELDALDQEGARLDAESGEVAAAERALGDDLEQTEASLAENEALVTLEQALEQAEATRAARARDDQDAEARQGAARRAAGSARERVTSAQAGFEQSNAAASEAAAKRRERELERAALASELERAARQRQALSTAMADVDSSSKEVEAELAAARRTLEEAKERQDAARARHAEAAAELTRLRDRQSTEQRRLSALSGETELWRERVRDGEARLRELAEREAAARAEIEASAMRPSALAEQEADLRTRIAALEDRLAAWRDERAAAEGALADLEKRVAHAESERLEAREAGARLEARLERARAECESAESAWRERAPAGPVEVTGEPPSAEQLAELEARLARLGAARERLGPVNLRAVDELAELDQRLQTLESERDEVTSAIERLRRAITALNREGRERLRAAFAEVEKHFEALFKRLFGGGQARLALTDLEDPLAAGLELAASPPGKKLQSVSMLSGGEKALTALALIFAVFLTRPSPLCILDEVDAPLDDANVGRFIDLLEEIAAGTDTRFIVITHHPLTMARMHRLYGVTMLERGVSQLVSVDLQGAVELRATA